jgi:hypothetical protein
MPAPHTDLADSTLTSTQSNASNNAAKHVRPYTKKMMEDLEPELMEQSTPLPVCSALSGDLTERYGLSQDDRIRLWTVVGFLEDHGQQLLGLEEDEIPDLGKLSSILNATRT